MVNPLDAKRLVHRQSVPASSAYKLSNSHMRRVSSQAHSQLSKRPMRNSALKMLTKPQTGVVDRTIAPERVGRVKYAGSYWSARLFHAHPTVLFPGDPVTVVAIQGITLLVVPVEGVNQPVDRRVDSEMALI
jgi:membrane-bound ClpP family serine protease